MRATRTGRQPVSLCYIYETKTVVILCVLQEAGVSHLWFVYWFWAQVADRLYVLLGAVVDLWRFNTFFWVTSGSFTLLDIGIGVRGPQTVTMCFFGLGNKPSLFIADIRRVFLHITVSVLTCLLVYASWTYNRCVLYPKNATRSGRQPQAEHPQAVDIFRCALRPLSWVVK